MVIVNDGGDAREIERLLSEFNLSVQKKITLIHNPTSVGMEAASNIGIQNTAGDYLVIHDDDDSWSSKFIETCVGYLDKHRHETHIGGVITHSMKVVEQITDGNIIELYREPHNAWLKTICYAGVADQNLFPPISFVFRREMLPSIGHFRVDLPVLGDWDFNLRVLKEYEIHVIPKLLAMYHHRRLPEDENYGSSVIIRKDLHRLYEKSIRDEIKKGAFRKHERESGIRSNPIETSWEYVQKCVSPYMRKKLDIFLNGKKRVAIFGASLGGRSWKAWFNNHIPYLDICFFLDNDLKKQGKIIDGILVKPPEALSSNEIDAILVASSGYHEIAIQLNQFSLVNEREFFIL
jgi:glycosyltransferase involved in cell wall biosynthesis